MLNTTIDQARSGIAAENLQEILDAATSAAHATDVGQQQYETPPWLAAGLVSQLVHDSPAFTFDPQCASGQLLNAFKYSGRFGWDIDNRFAVAGGPIARVTGNCVKLAEIFDDLYPDFRFPSIAANPPFAIRWKQADGTTIDSTLWTWQFIKKHLALHGSGFIISSWSTIERMQIHLDPWAYLYQKFPAGIWPNTKVEIGVVHFYNFGDGACPFTRMDHVWYNTIPETPDFYNVRNPFAAPWPAHRLRPDQEWATLNEAYHDEIGRRPKWNIYLDKAGILRTYLSTRAKVKFDRSDVLRLAKIDNCHPLTLTTERESRKVLYDLLARGIYQIEPDAEVAIRDALKQVESLACPIMPITDFELVAYADEEDTLKCKRVDPRGLIALTVGKSYELSTGTYKFKEKFTRKKIHYDEKEDKTELVQHDCELSGADRFVQIIDDNGAKHRFMERPNTNANAPHYGEHHESVLWQLFNEPYVPTIAETCEEQYEKNLSVMRLYSTINGFTYYAGQLDYYARMGSKDYGVIGADVGTGKTLGALTIVALKNAGRSLIIAPQGTMRSSEDDEEGEEYKASQWVQEIQKFASSEPVFQLFCEADLDAILHANGGKLPNGIYITYPQAYFSNGAFEFIPQAWDDEEEHEKKFCDRTRLKYDENRNVDDWYSRGIGQHDKTGIRCVAHPSLSTKIACRFGEPWDLVILDEGHLVCNENAQITKNLLRLQPKYRFIMTATPIPNIVTNLFTLMGWCCVPDWYLGNRRNAAWPYSVDESFRFSSTFLSQEVDLTAQAESKAAGKKGWRNVGVKVSPIISSPARLLKLLKPSMAYISKERCNPNLQPCEVIDVRVDMGAQQSQLYQHWLNRGAYEYKNPLTIARVQSSRLRGVCSAPTHLDYNKFTVIEDGDVKVRRVRSDFNPKLSTILELAHQCLSKGEQVVIVSSRVGLSEEIASRLSAAGIEIARIDNTVPADMHTAEANRFKKGAARVMLMGIKCAQGHSFDMCPNLIIGALEWSYGTLHQAKGRVWRLTSKKPVKVWIVLIKGSIEELLFDRVATKQDAATLCLHGKRVPRDFKTLDAAEVLAEHIVDYVPGKLVDESSLEDDWTELRRRLELVSAAHAA